MTARRHEFMRGLEKLGLSANEAKVYLALLERGRLGAPALIEITRVPRGTIYPVLTSLTDRGIIQAGAAYGGRYQAVPPEQAVRALIRWEKDALVERERFADDLAKELEPLAAKVAEDVVAEPIEILRDQRAITERFEQLHREAQKEIAGFVKGRPAVASTTGGHPLEFEALRRGVKIRGIYEKAVLDDEDVAPYLDSWMKSGEEARVFDGILPHKLAVFDGRAAIVPVMGSEPGSTCYLVIRDPMVAGGLLTLFNTYWERSRPLQLTEPESKPKSTKPTAAPTVNRGGATVAA